MATNIALITGANSGIGYATAQVLAAEGFHVILSGRSLSKVEAATAEIQSALGDKQHGKLTTLQLDVTDQASIDQAVTAVREQFGHLDIIINNAGIEPKAYDLATSMRLAYETNTIGPALVSAAFRPLLQKASSPWLIYVSSVVGSLDEITNPNSWMHQTDAGTVAYRASKAALNMVALHEQLELKDSNIKIRVVCPGFVVSNLRGLSEEERTGGGHALDPKTSGQLILSVVRGEREDDKHKLIRTGAASRW